MFSSEVFSTLNSGHYYFTKALLQEQKE